MDDKAKLKSVMNSVARKNEAYTKNVKMVILGAYAACFITYFIIIISQNPKE